MRYTGTQVVEMVDHLNSTRTLRRWTELALNLCDATFHYEYMNVGYKNTQLKYLAYSESDIQKFQLVAHTKKKLGLQESIKRAFNNEKQLTLTNLDKRMTVIVQSTQKILDAQGQRIKELEQQKILSSQENYRLTKRIETLEQALESKSNLKVHWREWASP